MDYFIYKGFKHTANHIKHRSFHQPINWSFHCIFNLNLSMTFNKLKVMMTLNSIIQPIIITGYKGQALMIFQF